MLASRASVIIGILALVMGSAAVYGILNTGTEIQAKTDTIKIPDYSAKLDSLNSQVNSLNSQIGSINSNIPDLSTLKTNLADIHEKLADLDNMKTDIANMQKKLDDLAGSAQAGSSIAASLVSPTGNTYPSSTTANSYGSYVMFFSTPSSYETGTWYADVTNLGQHKILSFTLQPAS